MSGSKLFCIAVACLVVALVAAGAYWKFAPSARQDGCLDSGGKWQDKTCLYR